jgi:hypothetical protein
MGCGHPPIGRPATKTEDTMTKRVYGSTETNSVYNQWLRMINNHKAVQLKDGENPSDYPDSPVAYETLNFGWILSKPNIYGKRSVLVQF